jgi:hypothetical protein
MHEREKGGAVTIRRCCLLWRRRLQLLATPVHRSFLEK